MIPQEAHSTGEAGPVLNIVRGDGSAIGRRERVPSETVRGGAGALTGLQRELIDHALDLIEQQARLTTLDPVTGTTSWPTMAQRVTAEVSRAHRHDRALALLLVEVDGLAALRRVKGPGAADAALAALAARIQGELRVSDELGRCDDTGFLVVCPETDAHGATVVASRIVGRSSGVTVEVGGHTVPLTVSVGLALLITYQTAAGLLAEARRALGRAQALGNRWSN